MTFAKIEHALTAMRSGEFVVVVDDAGRENEGDLIISAQCATTEATAFMVRYTSGLICVALAPERIDQLELPLMVESNSEVQGTAFTVSVDLKQGTSTGISAADRSATIRALADVQRGRGTCFRCAMHRAACCSALGTRRPRSISRASPGTRPRARCARS
jgi:3,4-dihydroxy 2-butanone 4-phosphate synthase/GTP cyclohydrolase II